MSIHIYGINLPKRREEVYLLAVDSDGRVYHRATAVAMSSTTIRAFWTRLRPGTN